MEENRTRKRSTNFSTPQKQDGDNIQLSLFSKQTKQLSQSAHLFVQTKSYPSNAEVGRKRRNPNEKRTIPFYLDSDSDEELVKLDIQEDYHDIPDVSNSEEDDSDDEIKGVNDNWSSTPKKKFRVMPPPLPPKNPSPARPHFMRMMTRSASTECYSLMSENSPRDPSVASSADPPKTHNLIPKPAKPQIKKIERPIPRIRSLSVPKENGVKESVDENKSTNNEYDKENCLKPTEENTNGRSSSAPLRQLPLVRNKTEGFLQTAAPTRRRRKNSRNPEPENENENINENEGLSKEEPTEKEEKSGDPVSSSVPVSETHERKFVKYTVILDIESKIPKYRALVKIFYDKDSAYSVKLKGKIKDGVDLYIDKGNNPHISGDHTATIVVKNERNNYFLKDGDREANQLLNVNIVKSNELWCYLRGISDFSIPLKGIMRNDVQRKMNVMNFKNVQTQAEFIEAAFLSNQLIEITAWEEIGPLRLLTVGITLFQMNNCF